MGMLLLSEKRFAGRQCSDKGDTVIRLFCPYDRVARVNGKGKLVIGYNHTHAVKETDTMTVENAHALLRMDLGVVAAAICEVIKVPLLQDQFDALCSFVHDFGVQVLRHAKFVEMLNGGNYTDIPAKLVKYHVSDTGMLHDATRKSRRHAECQLWMGISPY